MPKLCAYFMLCMSISVQGWLLTRMVPKLEYSVIASSIPLLLMLWLLALPGVPGHWSAAMVLNMEVRLVLVFHFEGFSLLVLPVHVYQFCESTGNACIICFLKSTHCGLVMPYGDTSKSGMAQVVAWCLMAPSHYLNHCWLPIKGVQGLHFLTHWPLGNLNDILGT